MSMNAEEPWYYCIETEPGQFTPGHKHPNLAVTRKLLRHVQLAGMDCLDFGTQEAVIPVLLKKAGAKSVVAYDRFDHTERIKYVAGLHKVDFRYIPGLQARALPARLDAEVGSRFFDLTVFSGVLYHLIDPLGILALVRGLTKLGGLFLIETVVRHDAQEALLYNARGALYGSASNYFVPTTGWLDYNLRLLGLRPLQAAYLDSMSSKGVARLAILCRSEAEPCPLDSKDAWMRAGFHRRIFENESHVDWDGLLQTHSDITFTPFDATVADIGSRTLTQALAKHPPHRPVDDEWRLLLNSTM